MANSGYVLSLGTIKIVDDKKQVKLIEQVLWLKVAEKVFFMHKTFYQIIQKIRNY